MAVYEGVGDVDVEDLLETIGLDNVSRIGRGEVQYSCPFTEGHSFGDSHPSAHMNQEKLVFRCKGCGRAGTALELVSVAMRCSAGEALRFLRERYGDSFRPPEGGSVMAEMKIVEEKRVLLRAAKATAKLPDEGDTVGPQGIFTIDWASGHEAAVYMRGRGFTPDILRDWGVGYDTWTNRIAIPIRNEEGRLIGFKGRAINPAEHTRYMLLGDTVDRKPRYGTGYGFDMHETSGVLFGLNRAIRTWELSGAKRKRLVVCEGELNAIALHAAGVTNAVAIGMTTMSDGQARLIRWYADEVVLFYDSDTAGHGATWGYFDDKDRWHEGLVERLSSHVLVRVAEEHEFDPAAMLELGRLVEVPEMIDRAPSWMAIAVE